MNAPQTEVRSGTTLNPFFYMDDCTPERGKKQEKPSFFMDDCTKTEVRSRGTACWDFGSNQATHIQSIGLPSTSISLIIATSCALPARLSEPEELGL
jgi:hypothetical protein